MVLYFAKPLPLPKKAKREVQKKLEEQGFGDCVVNLEEGTLAIPDLYRHETEIIASVVAQAGDYRLDLVLDDIVDNDDTIID